jgi:hypothetical protein
MRVSSKSKGAPAPPLSRQRAGAGERRPRRRHAAAASATTTAASAAAASHQSGDSTNMAPTTRTWRSPQRCGARAPRSAGRAAATAAR